MKTTKTLTAGLLALTVAAPALAQMATPDWDTDGDGALLEGEFTAAFDTAGTFGTYDADTDGLLSEAEWNAGLGEADWGERDYEMGAFADMDANADGMLDEAEYGGGWFKTYDADADGMLNETEMGEVDRDLAEGGLFDG